MKHKVPNVKFKVREGDVVLQKRVMIFLKTKSDVFNHRAFTPTCSSKQLYCYESKYNEIKEISIDEIYCISVNDSFVMNV